MDNQLVYRTEIKFEKEDGETELTLKFLRGTYESEYDFEIETEGDEQTIEIDYKISENGIVLEEGEYEVLIINGQTVKYRQKNVCAP